MSALLEGARRLLGRKSDLADQIYGLDQAVEACRGRLDDEVVDPAATIVQRAGARLRLSPEHTVVAIAGATGSGKSSTFNALTGLDLAAVGVRRPTTSWASACIWGGPGGAEELLEWMGIPLRHQTTRDSMLDSGRDARDLKGLVLLDLPDHDSTEVSHHLEVQRLIVLADLMIWVLDPQKYADKAVHEGYFRPMATHKDVMIVMLNHIDEVPHDASPGDGRGRQAAAHARRARRRARDRHVGARRRGHRRAQEAGRQAGGRQEGEPVAVPDRRARRGREARRGLRQGHATRPEQDHPVRAQRRRR